MNFFHTLLSIVFPETEEQALVRALTKADIDKLLYVSPLPHGVGLTSYRDEQIRALVWEAKYKKNAHAHALMAHVLGEHLSSHYDEVPILIPIPLSPKRAKERGYNQVEEVLKAVCEDPLLRYDASLLVRVRETTPQTQLGRKERLTNLSGAFAVPDDRREQVKGKHFILVDDVATTGTTLTEARRALMHAGAKAVATVAFAH
jgi:ComF family protein